MDHHLAISRVLGTLTQLVSPAGRPGARMLPLHLMQEAFARFIEYAEGLRGDEHVDATRHRRALPFIRDLAPMIEHWSLDAVPREVTLKARVALDAWFPEEDRTDFWARTDRDAEAWAARPDKDTAADTGADEGPSERDVALLQWAMGQTPDGAAANDVTNGQKRSEDPSDQAARYAMAMSSALNLAAVLASPRVLRKVTPVPSREHLIEHCDAFIAALSAPSLSSVSADVAATRAAAARLRAACTEWSPAPEATPEMQRAARDLLAASGIPEPPGGGWDAFEGSWSGP